MDQFFQIILILLILQFSNSSIFAKIRCNDHRKRILEISQMVTAMHAAGAFSALEMVDTIYYRLMKKNSKNKPSNHYFSLTDTILDSLKYPVGKVFGQDIFRSNNLSFYNKAYDAQPGENYLLGAGDELTISIWGMANHSETVVVNEKGYISTQIAGRIYVGNKSFTVSKSSLILPTFILFIFDLSMSKGGLDL